MTSKDSVTAPCRARSVNNSSTSLALPVVNQARLSPNDAIGKLAIIRPKDPVPDGAQ